MTQAKNSVITVVSGLPRTGTSMMMRMLAAGGMPVLTDGQRTPDDDNPEGYYELERVKRLESDTSWLADAQGKAIKVIYRLLYYLPVRFQFKVIFMQRNLAEVVASQKVMLSRRQQNGSGLTDQQLIQAYQNEIAKIESWIRDQSNFAFLPVDFNETVKNPEGSVVEIEKFLGQNLDLGQMVDVVNPALYRQKVGDPPEPGSGA